MVVALLIAATVFIIRFIAPQAIGEQVRRHVEQSLRDHYPQLDISIGRGRVEPNLGLILNDIRIAVPDQSAESASQTARGLAARLGIKMGSTRELVRVNQVVVIASANLSKLMEKESPLAARRILVTGVHANTWLQSDGKLSLQQLFPLPQFGKTTCPRIEVRGAKVVLDNNLAGTRPIELALNQALILKHAPLADPAADESKVPATTTISVSGDASFLDQFGLHLTAKGDVWDCRAECRGAKFSSELIQRLPQPFRDQLQPLRGLELLADTTAVARIQPGQPINYATRTKIHDGRFRHPRSSMPLQKISGVVTCDPSGATVESCQASWGDAHLRLKGKTVGYSQPLQAELSVSASNLMLDQRLAAIIPAKLEAGWHKFEPHGLIDVPKASFNIRGNEIQTTARITCKGVDINYDRFPYPIRHVTGTLDIRDNRASSEMMSGRIGGRLMQCLFDVPTKPGSEQARVFSVAMDGPIAIDGELLQALTPRGEPTTKLETFVRSLNPLGAIHLRRGTLRMDDQGIKEHDLELNVSDGTLRFDKFPYPIYNVAGEIHVVNDLVTISGFHGANANGGAITCDGRYRIAPQASSRNSPGAFAPATNALVDEPSLQLDFGASRISLDESLRSSLPEASQQTWDSLWPSGVLDSMEIHLSQADPGAPLSLNVAGRQFDSKRIGSDTLRLQPSAIPYRLDIIDGAVRYEGGRVTIDSIRAEHGQSMVSADGGCERLPDGRWLLTVDVHSGSRLIPDAELTNALPEQMRGALRGLNLRGPVGLRGLCKTLLSDPLHPEPEFEWDIALQLEGNRIGDVGPVHDLRGELSVNGRKDAAGLRAQGEVRIDSMHVNDLQITQLRGPYQIQGDQLRLGNIGSSGIAAHPLEGRLFDGTLRMDGSVKLSDASFDVRLGLDQAKVQVLLAELGHAQNDLSGTLVANMTLEGLLGTTELLRGRGKATVDNANLYQLPVLIQLLNVLSISPTEDVAFTNAEIDYTLIEDQLEFSNLKLWGSLIALHGSGTLDRRQELDLTFNTRVSPRNMFTRIIRPLGDQRYTLWSVDVKGPLSSPTIERRALDSVGQTLERLFPGMNPTVEANRNERSAGLRRMFQ
ncbi:AsmA-like C-terminal region-containing protein [Stieleria tagensis]|uniref:AsmA-like C-terminal region-containing protein n=1 Tax=Stieleria tagensis TaxID=2956795 RepID=UPI00209AE833|nr:AsmA-like C-terminal region-containing protein [Stieleria tagensis]